MILSVRNTQNITLKMSQSEGKIYLERVSEEKSFDEKQDALRGGFRSPVSLVMHHAACGSPM